MRIDPGALDRAAALVTEADRIGMTCHVGPDGDALGSMLALAVTAERAGKTVFASFGEPFVIPDSYRFMPVDRLVPPAEVPRELPVFLTFDAGSIDRFGTLEATVASATEIVVLDHHLSGEGFGSVELVDPSAAATGELAVALLDRLGWEIDAMVARCLLAAVVTDTGRFQYSNTTPDTLRLAARLVAAGARPEEIGRHVYEESPFAYLGVAGEVLAGARLDPERRFVWAVLRSDDVTAAGIALEDTDPLIDAVRVARESDVAALLKVLEDDRTKVSLRSRGRVDVSAIAEAFGGGGHHNAAGFTFQGGPDEAAEAIRSRLEPVDPIP